MPDKAANLSNLHISIAETSLTETKPSSNCWSVAVWEDDPLVDPASDFRLRSAMGIVVQTKTWRYKGKGSTRMSLTRVRGGERREGEGDREWPNPMTVAWLLMINQQRPPTIRAQEMATGKKGGRSRNYEVSVGS